MSYKARPMGYKASGALEDVLSLLMDAERITSQAHRAVVEDDKWSAVVSMSDIRTKIMLAHSTIVLAKAGKFED
jgi:hypothetical protein